MTTTKAAGSSGPEKLLHQDHDSAQQAIHDAADASGARTRDEAEGLVASARARLGDVGDRARDAVEGARDWATDAYDTGAQRLNAYGQRMNDRVGDGRDTVTTFAQENPLLVGVVGLAAGLLLGALLPRTRHEDRALGEWSDGVRGEGLRFAREATNRGRAYVEDTLSGAAPGAGDRETSPLETHAREFTGQRSGPSGRYQNH